MTYRHIRSELIRIRNQIYLGNESVMWIWVIEGRLACAQRPLRDNPTFGGGPGKHPPPLASEARPFVEAWVDRVLAAGFQSIISLLEPAQLDRHYVRGGLQLHRDGLLGYYRSRGLAVESIPCMDYQPPTDEQNNLVWAAFRTLPSPVLLHCSASIDRTLPVAAFTVEQEKSK